MTRVTNFGRKRTYLEASQDHAQMPGQMQVQGSPQAEATSAASAMIEEHPDKPISISEPPTKRRKRLSMKLPSQREEFESGMLWNVGFTNSRTLKNT